MDPLRKADGSIDLRVETPAREARSTIEQRKREDRPLPRCRTEEHVGRKAISRRGRLFCRKNCGSGPDLALPGGSSKGVTMHTLPLAGRTAVAIIGLAAAACSSNIERTARSQSGVTGSTAISGFGG